MHESVFSNQLILGVLASGAWGLSGYYAIKSFLGKKIIGQLDGARLSATVVPKFSAQLKNSLTDTVLHRSPIPDDVIADYQIADFSSPLSQWLIMTLAIGVCGSLVCALLLSWGVGILFGTLALYGSYSIIRHQAQQRRDLMNSQLPLAFEHIAYSVGAGQHLLQSVDKAIESLDIPISSELRTMRDHMAYGATFEEAMVALDEKWGLDELHKITTALTLNARYGGNIKALLLRAASNMKQSDLLRKNLRAQTAQGQLSMRIVLFAPIVLVTILSFVMPGFWQTLTQSKSGQYMMLSAALLDFMGYKWIKSVVRVGW